jgi:peptide/nickel transport system substrate-binding protein
MRKQTTIRCTLAVAAALVLGGAPARAETVLRIGMTLADIPVMNSQPDQGGEGWRFIGVTLFDGLIGWDLASADKPSVLIPGLATEWAADPEDRTRWTFKLRQGVKFHDGTPFNADAVVWNFDKLCDRNAPQYDPRQVAQTFGRTTRIKSYRKLDDMTFELVTHVPDALVPYYLSRFFFASPAHWQKVGRDWAEYSKQPVGTGPWKLDKFVPRERAELVRNPDYWDKPRVPRTDRLILLPIPDAATRTSALLSGQVDWVEAPAPDAVPRLRQAGMRIVTNSYPHVWPYHLSRLPGSPWNDVRVRKAANLAIDRAGIVKLLGGVATEAVGQVPRNHPWWGKPSFEVKYDPDGARKLLAEAGYGPGKPARTRFLISTSGSGQMQPLAMNQYIQENLNAVGFEVELEAIEWNTMTMRRSIGAHAKENAGIDALNNSWTYIDPDFGFIGVLESSKISPNGNNWGNVRDPVIDALAIKIREAFDPAEQDRLIAELHTRMVDEAAWIWVVHDDNPRAMSPKVKGFVQARNWIQDFSPITMH